ncbi:MAG: LPS export ABC transporter periplasmic protein LptC [Bacteroidota bacterium]|jgi:LPS export ABC transporter protein LptC
MIKGVGYILHLSRSAIFIATLGIIVACENDLATIPGLGKSNPEVDEVKDVQCYLSTNGELQARLAAGIMYRYHDTLPRIIFPNQLHVDFFGKDQQIQSYLNAKKGIYYESQGKVLLEDSVVVVRQNGDTLKTNKLTWEQSRHSFYTDENIEIRQRSKTIYGRGFESDDQLQNFRIDSLTGVMFMGG